MRKNRSTHAIRLAAAYLQNSSMPVEQLAPFLAEIHRRLIELDLRLSTSDNSTGEDPAEGVIALAEAYTVRQRLAQPDFLALIEHLYVAAISLGKSGSFRRHLVPKVDVAKSVLTDYLVCLECGSLKQSLKRHLRDRHKLSPDEYRDKWQLPSDYPMVSPKYSQKRQDIAKRHLLGTALETRKTKSG